MKLGSERSVVLQFGLFETVSVDVLTAFTSDCVVNPSWRIKTPLNAKGGKNLHIFFPKKKERDN